MQILKRKTEVREVIKKARLEGKTIGLVPTMGYLHDGHLSLMEFAKKENDFVVVSVFVNPTQFDSGEDLDSYPCDLERDAKLVKEVGVDLIFAPQSGEMYPENFQTYVELTNLSQNLCGATRLGHFRGVCTVVSKLFNIVQPDQAYFGQKDAQQAIILKKMVEDLDMPIEVRVSPIIREKNGLAMSSRNVNLNNEEHEAALILNRSLKKAKEMINDGERDAHKIQALLTEMIENEPLVKSDYISIVSASNLQPIERLTGPILIALAVFIGKTRLIDNIMMEVD
ncbi:MAG: pantoate--beta-alanine ligase [Halanaerobiales bacterium]|nr:pantoate--beta-alanine ligase [Halanaerobiales bacterium]